METLEELLSEQWHGDKRMVKHCLEHSIYIKLGDTYVDVGERKPRIDSDMWYDDETTAPNENYTNFKAYNMRSNAPEPISERVDGLGQIHFVMISPHYSGDKTDGKLAGIHVERVDEAHSRGRRATDEEIKLIDAALEDARKNYEKRLERYWKRYSHKVSARGYWANR